MKRLFYLFLLITAMSCSNSKQENKNKAYIYVQHAENLEIDAKVYYKASVASDNTDSIIGKLNKYVEI